MSKWKNSLSLLLCGLLASACFVREQLPCGKCSSDADCIAEVQRCKGGVCEPTSGAYTCQASPQEKPPSDGAPDALRGKEAGPEPGNPDSSEPSPERSPPPERQAPDARWRSCYTGPAGTEGKGLCKAGVSVLEQGKWSPCRGEILPTAELCDGKDNDCDGSADEDFSDKGQSCDAGVSSCKVMGTYQCTADGKDLHCKATPKPPAVEVCDGKDNDCDGKVDETCGARRFGGTQKDQRPKIAVDRAGNTYMMGLFKGALRLGTATLESQANATSRSFFLLKLDPRGQVLWAKSFGGATGNHMGALALDSSGSLYVAGTYQGKGTTFGGLTLKDTRGRGDLFVAKLDPGGRALWLLQSKDVAGTGTQASAEFVESIALGPKGGLFVAGYIGGNSNNNTAIEFHQPDVGYAWSGQLQSKGSTDILMLKLSAATGQVQWARTAGSSSLENALGVAVDAEGNPYFVGRAYGQPTFETSGSSITLADLGNDDGYLVKLDGNKGDALWATALGTGHTDQLRSVLVDHTGVYLVGWFGHPTGRTKPTSAQTLTTLRPCQSDADCAPTDGCRAGFCYKLPPCQSDADCASKDGCRAGFCRNAKTGLSTHRIALSLKTTGEGGDAMVLKFDPTGADLKTPPRLLWAQTIGNSGAFAGDGAAAANFMAFAEDGGLLIAGAFSGKVQLFPKAITLHSKSKESDVFIAKYSRDGDLQWGTSAGGPGFDECWDIQIGPGGHILAAGSFQNQAQFGSQSLTSQGDSDIFLWQLPGYGPQPKYKQPLAVQLGGKDAQVDLRQVLTDSNGDIYALGRFKGSITHQNLTWSSLPNDKGAKDYDLLVARFNGSGELQWLRQIGGTGADGAGSIALGAEGAVFVTGTLALKAAVQACVGIDSSVPSCKDPKLCCLPKASPRLVKHAGSDLMFFIARLERSDGAVLWVKTPQKSSSTSEGKWLVVDRHSQGGLYLAGEFFGSLTPGDKVSTAITHNLGNRTLFVARLQQDAKGAAFVWAQAFGRGSHDEAKHLLQGPRGHLYLSAASFQPYEPKEHTTKGLESCDAIAKDARQKNPALAKGLWEDRDIALLKLDADTGKPIWTRCYGGGLQDEPTYIAISPLGQLWLAGSFSSARVVFGNQTLTNQNPILPGDMKSKADYGKVSSDAFLFALRLDGSELWARSGFGKGDDSIRSLVATSTGHMAIAGSFEGRAALDAFSLQAQKGVDSFLALLDPQGRAQWLQTLGHSEDLHAFSLHEDPMGGLTTAGAFSKTLSLGSLSLTAKGRDGYILRLAP